MYCYVFVRSLYNLGEIGGEDKPVEVSFPPAVVLAVEEVAPGGIAHHPLECGLAVLAEAGIKVSLPLFAHGVDFGNESVISLHLLIEKFDKLLFIQPVGLRLRLIGPRIF